jgi:hypothetical protein
MIKAQRVNIECLEEQVVKRNNQSRLFPPKAVDRLSELVAHCPLYPTLSAIIEVSLMPPQEHGLGRRVQGGMQFLSRTRKPEVKVSRNVQKKKSPYCSSYVSPSHGIPICNIYELFIWRHITGDNYVPNIRQPIRKWGVSNYFFGTDWELLLPRHISRADFSR